MEELMREFIEELKYIEINNYIEIIDEEIFSRERNEYHNYIIFDDLTTEKVKEFRQYFIDNFKRTKIKVIRELYLE